MSETFSGGESLAKQSPASESPAGGVMPVALTERYPDGVFRTRKAIRFQHCDPFGIVFYPQYVLLLHEVVEDWFKDGLGAPFGALLARDGIGFPIARMEVDFLAPSRLDETLAAELAVEKLRGASLLLAVTLSGEGGVRLRARLTQVVASHATRTPVPIPDWLRERFARYVADAGS